MLENMAFLPTKGKNYLVTNIESGGGENLLSVPTLLSGTVDTTCNYM